MGATVVLPGNCWGDGGHGTGETGDGYFDGRRLGGLFDDAVWAWARETLDHAAGKEIAFACSGGGHRTAEALLRDPDAFDAVVLDSPADNTAGFLEQPWGELIGFTYTLLRPELFDGIMSDFYDGTFGGLDAAAEVSLGHGLPGSAIDAPIYLIYSTGDPAVTVPVTRDLALAVGDRPAPSTVVELDIEYHCQLDFPENMAAATDWLADVIDL
jgi:pimeloyl-ACP methyl ester carboxylesterase